MDLIGLINPVWFSNKQYFFTFINYCIRLIKTYIDIKKSNWLKYLKNYYSLYRTRSKKKHLIERLRLDYAAKL